MDEESVRKTYKVFSILKENHRKLIDHAAQLHEEIVALELSVSSKPDIEKAIKDEYVASNHSIFRCTKLYRDITGYGLKASKEAVEKILSKYIILK